MYFVIKFCFLRISLFRSKSRTRCRKVKSLPLYVVFIFGGDFTCHMTNLLSAKLVTNVVTSGLNLTLNYLYNGKRHIYITRWALVIASMCCASQYLVSCFGFDTGKWFLIYTRRLSLKWEYITLQTRSMCVHIHTLYNMTIYYVEIKSSLPYDSMRSIAIRKLYAYHITIK